MQRLIILFLFLFLALTATAQDIPEMRLVGKPILAEDEFVAVRDDNGRICAAIKVISDMEGFRYTSNNGVVRVDDEPGKDMVFLSANERVLEILHSGYKPMRIILHEIGIRLKGKQVWQIQVTGDRKQDPIPVTILTEPENAKIRIDGGEITEDIQHLLVPGSHRISAAKSGYASIDTIVHIDRNQALVRIRLEERSLYGTLDINVTPNDASITLVHKTGQTFHAAGSHKFTQLPSGKYDYQITRGGYRSKTGKLTLKRGQRLQGEISLQPLPLAPQEKSNPNKVPRLEKNKKWVWWVLGLAALVGGGTYYYISEVKDQSKPQGTVDVVVEWE